MNIRASRKVWRCRALSHYCPRIVPADRHCIFSQYAKTRKHAGARSRLSSLIFVPMKLEGTCEIFRCLIVSLEITGNYILRAERYNRMVNFFFHFHLFFANIPRFSLRRVMIGEPWGLLVQRDNKTTHLAFTLRSVLGH